MKTVQEYIKALDELRRYADLSPATNISAVLVPEPVLPELLLYTQTYIPSSRGGCPAGRALTLEDLQGRAQVRVKGRFQLAGFPIVDVPNLADPYVISSSVPFKLDWYLRKLKTRVDVTQSIGRDRPALPGVLLEHDDGESDD